MHISVDLFSLRSAEQKHTLGIRWKTEQSFDGKLCQEYLCQKLLKFDNWFSRYS